jgi:hypothetical protein
MPHGHRKGKREGRMRWRGGWKCPMSQFKKDRGFSVGQFLVKAPRKPAAEGWQGRGQAAPLALICLCKVRVSDREAAPGSNSTRHLS